MSHVAIVDTLGVDDYGLVVINTYDKDSYKLVMTYKLPALRFFKLFVDAYSSKPRMKGIFGKYWEIYVQYSRYGKVIFRIRIKDNLNKVSIFEDFLSLSELVNWFVTQPSLIIENNIYYLPRKNILRILQEGNQEIVFNQFALISVLSVFRYYEYNTLYTIKLPCHEASLVEFKLFGWEGKILYYLVKRSLRRRLNGFTDAY